MLLTSSISDTSSIDEDLVKRFKTGDESAFVEIMHRHEKKILRVAFCVLRSHTDAEEIVQDTFLCAHSRLRDFRGDCSLGSWLYLIAKNRSRNRYRYFRRHKKEMMCPIDAPIYKDGPTTLADVMDSGVPSPSDEIAAADLGECITEFRKKISRSHQKILTLRVDKHLSYGEISAVLDLEVGTVKSRLKRARNELRRLLAGEFTNIKYSEKD